MAQNMSDYLKKITQLHKSSIEKENAYVTNTILNSDCIKFKMKGFKPTGYSVSGDLQGFDVDQTFESIGEILQTFGQIGNKNYKHPVEYFINLVKYCKQNNISLEGFNKHTDSKIPLSLDEVYNALDDGSIDIIYPGVPDEIKNMARENHSCSYGVDMLIDEYNKVNSEKDISERESSLFKKDVDALKENLEVDFYNKKVEEWNTMHQAAVTNNIQVTGVNKAFAVRAYGNGAQHSSVSAVDVDVFGDNGGRKIRSGKRNRSNTDSAKKVFNASKNVNKDKQNAEPVME